MQGKIIKLPTNNKAGEIESEDGERFRFNFADLDSAYEGALNLSQSVEFDLYVDRNAGLIRANNVKINTQPSRSPGSKFDEAAVHSEPDQNDRNRSEWIEGKIIEMPTSDKDGEISDLSGNTYSFKNNAFFTGNLHVTDQSIRRMIDGMGFQTESHVDFLVDHSQTHVKLIRKRKNEARPLGKEFDNGKQAEWRIGKILQAPKNGKDGIVISDSGGEYNFNIKRAFADQFENLTYFEINDIIRIMQFKSLEPVKFLSKNNEIISIRSLNGESFISIDKIASKKQYMQPDSLKKAEKFLFISLFLTFIYELIFPSSAPQLFLDDPQFIDPRFIGFMSGPFFLIYFGFMSAMILAATRYYISLAKWFWVVVNIIVVIFSAPFLLLSAIVGPPIWVSAVDMVCGIIGVIYLFQADSTKAFLGKNYG